MARRLRIAIAYVGFLAIVAAATALIAAPKAQAAPGGCYDPLNVVGCVKHGIGGIVGGVADDAVTALAKDIMTAVVHGLEWLATVWVSITPPALTGSDGSATGVVQWLSSNLIVLTGALAIVSILVGAFRIAVEERPTAHARQLTKYLFTFVLVSASAAAFADTLIYASDQLAVAMIHNAIGSETFSQKLGTLLGVSVQAGAATGSPVGFAATAAIAFATIVLGILAFLAMVVQVMIMLLRGAMLVMLVGTLPMAAAASNTEVGMQWFKKQISWVIAWAAYPLAAAIVYSAAFLLPGQGGIDALLSGVMLLIVAVVALPTLIRFIVPMTSAVSGGSGAGAIAMEGAAAAMMARGLPSGAADVAGGSTEGADDSSTGGTNAATSAVADAATGAASVDGSTGGGSESGAGSTGGAASEAGAGAAGGEGATAAGAGAGAGAAAGAAGAAVGAVRAGMGAARGMSDAATSGMDQGENGSGTNGSGSSSTPGSASVNGSAGGEAPVGSSMSAAGGSTASNGTSNGAAPVSGGAAGGAGPVGDAGGPPPAGGAAGAGPTFDSGSFDAGGPSTPGGANGAGASAGPSGGGGVSPSETAYDGGLSGPGGSEQFNGSSGPSGT